MNTLPRTSGIKRVKTQYRYRKQEEGSQTWPPRYSIGVCSIKDRTTTTGPAHPNLGGKNPSNTTYLITSQGDTVVGTTMVRKRSVIDAADSANDAAWVRVILARACDPFSALLDVDLAPTMVVPERHARHDWHRVPHVVNVPHILGKNKIHVVRKVFIANPGQAVPDDPDSDTGVQL